MSDLPSQGGPRRPHFVQFYDGDDALVAEAGPVLAGALALGEAVVVVATPRHEAALLAYLAGTGVDPDHWTSQHRLICLDASATLDRLLVDGRPDRGRFAEVVGALIERARRAGRGVTAFGEMVGLLWENGQVEAALQLEGLWNEWATHSPFCLYCAYPSSAVGSSPCRGHQEVVCLHSAVVGGPLLTGSVEAAFEATPDAPRRARHFVAETLHRWRGYPFCEQAALIVSELAANAVVHARSPFTVGLVGVVDGLRISVRDTSEVIPLPKRVEPLTLAEQTGSGRGLALVEATSRWWGVDPVEGGKVVWAELIPE